MINLLNLLIASTVVIVPAGISTIFNVNTPWYQSLNKPDLQPPSIVFGIVWPILYLLLIMSIYILLNNPTSNYVYLVIGFGIFLNFIWTYIFFYQNNANLAFKVILTYLVLLIIQYYLTYQIDKVAANLLIPLILWIFFATYLNWDIINKN